MATPTATEDLLELASNLREAAKDTVLDAARVWRAGDRAAWSARLLSSAVDALDGAEEILGHAFAHAPIGPEELPPDQEHAPSRRKHRRRSPS